MLTEISSAVRKYLAERRYSLITCVLGALKTTPRSVIFQKDWQPSLTTKTAYRERLPGTFSKRRNTGGEV